MMGKRADVRIHHQICDTILRCMTPGATEDPSVAFTNDKKRYRCGSITHQLPISFHHFLISQIDSFTTLLFSTMMKILATFIASMSLAMAFQVAPNTRPATTLQMGFLDNMFQSPKKAEAPAPVAEKKKKSKKNDAWIHSMFKEPIHGHGSAENDLEEMYQAQQRMLAERRQMFGREGMRAKYKDYKADHLRDIPLHKHDPASLNKKEDDAMYVDENDSGFSFPWSLKP